MLVPTNARRHKVATILADGIGPEVIEADLELLEPLQRHRNRPSIEVIRCDWEAADHKQYGCMMPSDGLEQLRNHQASDFCAVGAPDYAAANLPKVRPVR